MTTTRRWLSFRTPQEKANWLNAAATIDAEEPSVRAMAQRVMNLLPADPNSRDWASAIGAWFGWVRDAIAYKEDRSHPRDVGDPTDGERVEVELLVGVVDEHGADQRLPEEPGVQPEGIGT